MAESAEENRFRVPPRLRGPLPFSVTLEKAGVHGAVRTARDHQTAILASAAVCRDNFAVDIVPDGTDI